MSWRATWTPPFDMLAGMAEPVSDTSPFLYLHQAGLLDLLPQMYGEILIPYEVQSELQEGRRRGFDAPDPDDLRWVRARPAPLNAHVAAFELDIGEAAAITRAGDH